MRAVAVVFMARVKPPHVYMCTDVEDNKLEQTALLQSVYVLTARDSKLAVATLLPILLVFCSNKILQPHLFSIASKVCHFTSLVVEFHQLPHHILH